MGGAALVRRPRALDDGDDGYVGGRGPGEIEVRHVDGPEEQQEKEAENGGPETVA